MLRGLYDDDDDYNDSDDSYNESRPTQPRYIADYNVDEAGCRVYRYTPFAISVYGIREKGVDSILNSISYNVDDYCKKGVTSTYVDPYRIISDNDFLITLSYTRHRDFPHEERIVGFAVVADTRGRTNGDDNSLYIDIICSNNSLHGTRFPGGKVILNAIVEYARNSGYDSVSLKALSNVVNYYRQFGFRFLKNGETEEQPHIRQLAEANASHRIATPGEANRLLLVERAILFSREVDDDGVPQLNSELLRENLMDQLALKSLPSDDEVSRLVGSVPSAARDDGRGGLHDLYFSLIKAGYADLKGCPGITKRQFVRMEEVNPGTWKLWMSCEEGGFQMRKLLRPGLARDADVDAPILSCSVTGGKRHKKHKKTRRHKAIIQKSRRRR